MAIQFVFEAIGTHWVIDLFEEISPEIAEGLIVDIHARIAEFDKNYSRFRADSWVMRLAQSAGTYTLPADAAVLFDMYKKMFDITDGLFTPLIGQTLVDAGYDAEYSLVQKKEMTEPDRFNEVVKYQPPFVTMNKPALLDFGAAGKGYLVDIVAELIESHNIFSYCVDAGGDMRHRSAAQENVRIGLENPYDTSQVLGVLSLSNKSIAGSAGNRRTWKNFHHIINPETQTSPKNIAAVWVVADSTILADALTTALYFVSPEILLHTFNFDYLILLHDMSVQGSLLNSPMLELYLL